MTVIFFIGTIILFLGIDWLVQKSRRAKAYNLAPSIKRIEAYPVRTPEGIFFSTSHTWLNLFPTGKVLLGIDDFVGTMLESPRISHLKKSGDAVRKGEPIMLLQSGDHTLTIQSPIDGNIIETNDHLASHPEILRQNLFTEGWSYLIKPNGLAQIKGFLLGSETKTWIQSEFRRLRDLVAGLGQQGEFAPAFLQDGGPPMAGLLNTLHDEAWKKFEDSFLQVI